ncbi:MAG: WD-40-like beta propeller repeat-containing protein [Solirubrobacterales bacterium]|nr:WD-40-like beta propeller repeat-containing protein [Solirubrobacterales bacterium]
MRTRRRPTRPLAQRTARLGVLTAVLLPFAIPAIASAAVSMVYVSYSQSDGMQLWRADELGENRYRVDLGLPDVGEPTLSPNGSQVAFQSGNDIVVTRIDGTNRRTVVAGVPSSIWWDQPSCFPDGSLLITKREVPLGAPSGTSEESLWRVNADGTGLHQIVAWGGPVDATHALAGPDQADGTVSPDGSQISFVSGRAPDGTSTNAPTVWLAGADGSAPRQLTTAPGPYPAGANGEPEYAAARDPSFSSDGQSIVYSRLDWKHHPELDDPNNPPGWPPVYRFDWDLFTVSTTGLQYQQLTRSPNQDEGYPDWSHTAQIVFSSWPTYSSYEAEVHEILASGTSETVVLKQGGTAFYYPAFGVTAPLPDAELLKQHRPYLKYDKFESFYADSPGIITDSYVPGKTGHSNYLKTAAGKTLAASDPALRFADLNLGYLGQPYVGGGVSAKTDLIDESNTTSTEYVDDALRMHSQTAYANQVEGRVVSYPDGSKVLQYWLFYYYNPKTYLTVGAHEGDWEMVQVHLDPDQVPTRATYSQHDHGERCDWVHVQRTVGGQPIAYVADGSHANYFSSGYHFNGFDNDNSGGDGPAVSSPGVNNVTTPPNYILWPGVWGGSASSPPGPAGQTSKWNDPVGWSGGYGCSEGQTPAPTRSVSRRQSDGVERRFGASPRRPALPRVRVERSGRVVRIDYQFGRPPRVGGRAPWLLLTSVPSKYEGGPPRTVRTVVSHDSGTVRQVAASEGPVRLRYVVVGKAGNRSAVRSTLLP